MPLSVGDRLGPYEVLAPIGAGGMGEVYRAKDTKLKRDVALKVLPSAFASDPERMARFQREAEVLASLNHPNIAAIYGVEHSSDGAQSLAMEMVAGESPKGPLAFDDAWRIASQIADALEYAHEKGVVHRDLKPANVKVTPEGVVKLLDFGLAKAFTNQREISTSGENSPTLTFGATEVGVIMGTAAYMAPEQAKGKVVDKRADIWAFGVVLYELLTGDRLFEGDDAADTLAQVLTKQPDLEKVPRRARRLVEECLQKNPKQRLRDIGDAKRLLEEGRAESPSPAKARVTWKVPWMAAAGVVAIAGAVAAWAPWRAAPGLPKPVRFQIATPPGVNLGSTFSVSPDGTKLAYAGVGSDGATRMWVRAMDALESRAVTGTEGATDAPFFWSYDSRFLAFYAGGKLKKVDVAGGPAQTICEISATVVGGSWNRDGVILFGTNTRTGIERVSSAGGVPSPVTAMNAARKDAVHAFPVFLPDGKHFLYLVRGGAPDTIGVYLGSLDSKPDRQDPKRLVDTGFGPGFVTFSEGISKGTQGAILYYRDGTLLVQPFDLRALRIAGEAVPLAEQLGSHLRFGDFSASDNGTLAYRGAGSGGQRLGWFDRQGKSLGTMGGVHDYSQMALSPDGVRVATVRTDAGNRDIWLTAFSRGGDTRLTFGPAVNLDPVWSPDGKRIAFASNHGGGFGLYQHASDGAGQDELLFQSEHNKSVTDWSRDGRFLLYDDADPKTKFDLWVLPMEVQQGERKPIPFLRTEFNEREAKFSPDGHWIAYRSDESGINEIYVRPFPAPEGGGGKSIVSQAGGMDAHWRGDGKELFYLAPDGNVMAVPVSTSGSAFQPGAPAVLFKGPANPFGWDVTADGKRFLFAVPVGESAQAPFTVILNWMSLLKK